MDLHKIMPSETLFSELANTIKWSSQKSIMLQVGLMKCCNSSNNIIEKQMEKAPTKKRNDATPATNKVEIPSVVVTEEKRFEETVRDAGDTGNYVQYWQKILDTLKTNGKIMLYTNLIGTKAKKANDMCIEIEFAGKITPFAKTVLEQYENKEEIKKMVGMEEGQKMQIKYIENATKTATTTNKNTDKIPDDIGININIIDA